MNRPRTLAERVAGVGASQSPVCFFATPHLIVMRSRVDTLVVGVSRFQSYIWAGRSTAVSKRRIATSWTTPVWRHIW
jgi:hypothetical protein